MKTTILNLTIILIAAFTITGCMSSGQPQTESQLNKHIPLVGTKQSISIIGTKDRIKNVMIAASKYPKYPQTSHLGNHVEKKKGFDVSFNGLQLYGGITVYYSNIYDYNSGEFSDASMITYKLKVTSEKLAKGIYKYTFNYPSYRGVQVGQDISGNNIDQIDSQENIQADFDNVYAALIKNASVITAEFKAEIPKRKVEAEKQAQLEEERLAKEAKAEKEHQQICKAAQLELDKTSNGVDKIYLINKLNKNNCKGN